MKLFIPEIGDEIILTKNWTLTLYAEKRNVTLGEQFGYYFHNYYTFNYFTPKYTLFSMWVKKPYDFLLDDYHETMRKIITNKEYEESIVVSLPKDTKLKIDRVYIRKGASDFSSVSFTTKINNKKVRFWAKLKDVNNIEFKKVDLVV